MDNNLLKHFANNTGTELTNLQLQIAQLQTQNDQLQKENSELKIQLNDLRKGSDDSEPRRHNVDHQQNRNKGIKQ